MEKKVYGYIRVSTCEQNIDRQIEALKNFGVTEKNIFIDKVSGKNFDRPAYKRMLRKIKPADTVVIKSIDRLGRNFFEILEQWKIITQKKLSDIVVLDMPLLDTCRHSDDLTGKFISSLVLQLLSYVAEIEREFLRQRQAEGIATAKKRGVKFGRPAKKIPENFDDVLQDWRQKKISAREAGHRLNVDYKTFLKWTRQH